MSTTLNEDVIGSTILTALVSPSRMSGGQLT